jgi:hypothetical protein
MNILFLMMVVLVVKNQTPHLVNSLGSLVVSKVFFVSKSHGTFMVTFVTKPWVPNLNS